MPDNICAKCGEKLSARSNICSACGQIATATSQPARKQVNDHFIIIVILVLTAAAYMIYQSLDRSRATADDSNPQMPSAGYSDMTDRSDFAANLPTEYEPLVTMGNALMDQGDFALAVECYVKALEQRPDDPDVLTDLGACRHALGQNTEAIAAFEKALAADPSHIVAKFNLGIVFANLGDTARARQWWEKLLDENPPEDLRDRVELLLK